MKLTLLTLLLLVSIARVEAQKHELADVIFLNGDIYRGALLPYMPGTQEILNGPMCNCIVGADPRVGANVFPRAQALAVKDGRILAVGTNDEIKKFHGGKTATIDLGGRFVLPGFNDSHLHLAGGGSQKLNVNLVGAASLDEMKQRVADRAKTIASGEWIQGGGWDHTLWAGQKLPTRQDLDTVTGEHPAFFVRVDGHIAIANSAALKAAGINRDTKPPAGGSFDHDDKGELTGIVRESAQGVVTAKIPPPSPAQRRKGLELAFADAVQHGLTSVQDNSGWEDFLVMEDMEREGALPIRVSEWLNFHDPVEVLQQHRAHHSQTDSMLHTGMLKGFMDGSLGSRTAALLAPYADDAHNTGLPQYDQDTLNKMARERVAAGFQLGFHAIGDAAAEMALTAFQDARLYAREKDVKHAAEDDFRFRIEHDQVVTARQVPRYFTLGVIASVQPNHLLTDMNWAEERIGPERAKHSYPWADYVKNKVIVAFGTDYPVEPLAPFRGMYAAVTRKNEAGTKTYFPEQKLTIDQAIAAYTTGAAFAEFEEKEKGVLAPGMLADFVVLDRDLTKVDPPQILQTKVLRTVVGGKTVYEADAGK